MEDSFINGGELMRPAVLFDSRSMQYKKPFGAVPTGADITFNIKVLRELGVNRLEIILTLDGEDERRYPLEWIGSDEAYDLYRFEIQLNKAGLYWYCFELNTAHGNLKIGRDLSCQAELQEKSLVEKWQLTIYDRNFRTPDWLKGGLIYHIFVDRFCHTGLSSPPDTSRGQYLRDDWNGTPEFRPLPNGDVPNVDFFGGDLNGIIEKLDYLSQLGITCIYLSPIFESPSNHKYDTGDYTRVDPMFGDNDTFRRLCAEAQYRGIRIILDGVFNHTGSDSRYFNKNGRYPTIGAYQSKESPYYSWYTFQDWPDDYASWWGIKTLPAIDETIPSVQEFFITDKDSIVRRWLRVGAAGWRLDVADELPDEFISLLRHAAKEEKAEAIILGEVWEDASNKISYGKRRRYLLGDSLDGVMNYPWREAILNYLGGGVAEELNEAVMTILENYPPQAVQSLMNSLGTHDTPRLLTLLGGPSPDQLSREEQAVYRLTAQERTRGKALLKLALVLQMTLPGVPCIYYGDEAGMEGYSDPFNRRGFPWGAEDMDVFQSYKEIIGLRTNSVAARFGDFLPVYHKGPIFAFERRYAAERLLVGVNRGDSPVTVFFDGGFTLDIAPVSYLVSRI
jgi:cyclomaltodextrinase